uniref:uncharacterized protein LOC104266515 n=1 Tax=Ciona intestinalis TaxID=7719 RepID=UPI00089DB61D|nr:uncharacterized protein LOC104266515 [Ciona intestinalis]|eukprot:XP_009861214.2 uncharacterized protein LOC104266515 [Ciona intestinalis]
MVFEPLVDVGSAQAGKMGANKSKNKNKKKGKSDENTKKEATTAELAHLDEDRKDIQEDEIEEKIEENGSSIIGEKKMNKKRKFKKRKNNKDLEREIVFSNRTISNLSRALASNEWLKLAYALGFLPQGIAHFTGRASSAQNSYSQCSLMLKTWRGLTSHEEILPRLCDALQRIRRHDLALKVGLELAIKASPDKTNQKDPTLLPELLKLISENSDVIAPPYESSKMTLSDSKISFLARQILAREEWKRLAYALGFIPEEASQIIASASSSQNLYTQAHMMLTRWRDRTAPEKITGCLKAAFIRIRRHDLVFLLDIGAITAPANQNGDSLEDKIRKLKDQIDREPSNSLGSQIVAKFKDLQF